MNNLTPFKLLKNSLPNTIPKKINFSSTSNEGLHNAKGNKNLSNLDTHPIFPLFYHSQQQAKQRGNPP
ncbi:MAG: hypothetical protein A2Z51_11620 [Deltaproteobacteria bacterium RBG_19FT_COMBO_52_11]|nr:MAG: hypothetical protein A2Z51_11620 [Deltaproteobacteria bacterium RBG_19FT_COMBO_52_11]